MGISLFLSSCLNKIWYLILFGKNTIYYVYLAHSALLTRRLPPKQASNKATNLSPGDVCVQTHNMSDNKGGILFTPRILKVLLEKMKRKKFRGLLSDKHKQQVWEDIAQKWRILGKDKERDDRTFHFMKITCGGTNTALSCLK